MDINKILISQPVKFLNGGVILKIFSFSLNYLLADVFAYHKEISYAFVLLFDLLLGFIINRYFVFSQTQERKNSEAFSMFIIAGLGFRLLNWAIYAIILHFYELYILIAQTIATAIVLILKYFVYKRIFN